VEYRNGEDKEVGKWNEFDKYICKGVSVPFREKFFEKETKNRIKTLSPLVSSILHAVPVALYTAPVANNMRGGYFLLGLATAAAASVDSCPGYNAGAILSSRSSLTADLSLAGDACNVYGDDLDNLRLLVEYQTGKLTMALKSRPRH
jgi:hypothetical protein